MGHLKEAANRVKLFLTNQLHEGLPTTHREEEVDPYAVQLDHVYRLIRDGILEERPYAADVAELLSVQESCVNCNGPYSGPVGKIHDYCGQPGRLTYLVDITESHKVEKANITYDKEGSILKPLEPSRIPTYHKNDVIIEYDSKVPMVLAHNVDVGDYCSIFRLGAQKAVIGENVHIDNIIASAIEVGRGFDADHVMIERGNFGDDTRIKLCIILDKGEAKFGVNTAIDLLIIGPGVESVSFGYSSYVKEVYIVRCENLGAFPEGGEEFEVGKHDFLNSEIYERIIGETFARLD